MPAAPPSPDDESLRDFPYLEADDIRPHSRTPPDKLITRSCASEADLLDAYPTLKRDDIHAAMRYAADTIAHEEVVFIGKNDSDSRRD